MRGEKGRGEKRREEEKTDTVYAILHGVFL
jgi:hypothetical protein